MPVLSEADEKNNDNLVYKLDAKTKIFISIAMSACVIFFKSVPALIFITAITFFYALNLEKFKVMGIAYTAIILMWCMAIGCMKFLHMLSPMVPVTSPYLMMVPFLRVFIMMNVILVLALSSRVNKLLITLKSFKLPLWLYIPSAVMIRFVPTFINDVKQIHETMKIRGYRLNPLFIISHPVLSVRLIAAPVIFRALRSSDDLGIAAELKGIGNSSSIRSYNPTSLEKIDYITLFAALVIIVTGFCIQIYMGVDSTGMMP